MAKVTIAGRAVVITSDITLDDIKKVAKYRPEELIIKDKDKNPVFAISATGNSVNQFGISFPEKTRDDKGFAMITLITDPYKGEDFKGHVMDKIGGAVLKLEELEKTLPGVIKEIDEERKSLEEKITVMQ